MQARFFALERCLYGHAKLARQTLIMILFFFFLQKKVGNMCANYARNKLDI